MMENSMQLKDFNILLEYEDDEINTTLLALLEQKDVQPYKSKLYSFQQVNPPTDFLGEKKEQFSPLTDVNDQHSQPREINLTIFEYNKKVFVNIYPPTLPQVVDSRIFSDLDEKLKEAIFELENFLHENPDNVGREIIFTVPINKGNAHWVVGVIKINDQGRMVVKIYDPMGGSVVGNEDFKEFKEVIYMNFNVLNSPRIEKINHIIYDSTSFLKVERDLYCGGATRRIRDAIIFSENNNPYDWMNIDLRGIKITINHNDSSEAREADYKLLMDCKQEQIRTVGLKLKKRYGIINE